MSEASITSVKATFIEGAGQLSASLLGILNKVCGQIYALLLLSPKALSLDDIVEELEVSKGNVSVNIRLLEEYHLVRKIWVKGSRRDYYEAVDKVPTKVIREFLAKIHTNIHDTLSMIEKCRHNLLDIKTLPSDNAEAADYIKNRLALAHEFFQGANFLFEAMFAGKEINSRVLSNILSSELA